MNAETEDIAADKAEALKASNSQKRCPQRQTDAASRLADQAFNPINSVYPHFHPRYCGRLLGIKLQLTAAPCLHPVAGMITALPVTGEDATPLVFYPLSSMIPLDIWQIWQTRQPANRRGNT